MKGANVSGALALHGHIHEVYLKGHLSAVLFSLSIHLFIHPSIFQFVRILFIDLGTFLQKGADIFGALSLTFMKYFWTVVHLYLSVSIHHRAHLHEG